MILDGFNASALISEIRTHVVGARLQKFSQLTEDDFLLHLRSPGRTDYLIISLHPERTRLHLYLDAERPAGIVPNSFVMACRKRIGGTRLESVAQVGFDRRVEFAFSSGFSLVFDWAGRPATLLLIDTAERVAAGVFPARGRYKIHTAYEIEPNDKPSLIELSVSDLWSELEQLDPTTPLDEAVGSSAADWVPRWRRLFVADCQAETVGELQRPVFESAFSSFIEPLQNGAPFSPGIDAGRLTYRHPDAQFESMQKAANALWTESTLAPGVSDFRHELIKTLKKHRERAERKLAKRQQDRRGAESAPQDQLKGDLLLSYGSTLKRGLERFQTTDWEGRPLAIALDPRLNASENAQRYYNRSKKKKRALGFLTEQIALAEEEVEMWEELLFAAESSESRTDLEQVRKNLPTRRSASKRSRRAPELPSSGPRRYHHDGFQILVGRNPAQNEQLCFRTASRDDHWFHVRQGAGSHVLIRAAGAEPSSETKMAAAWLAAKFSRSSESPSVGVITTLARHLKKPKGGPLGKALYRAEYEITVDPTSPSPEGLTPENKNGPQP